MLKHLIHSLAKSMIAEMPPVRENEKLSSPHIESVIIS